MRESRIEQRPGVNESSRSRQRWQLLTLSLHPEPRPGLNHRSKEAAAVQRLTGHEALAGALAALVIVVATLGLIALVFGEPR